MGLVRVRVGVGIRVRVRFWVRVRLMVKVRVRVRVRARRVVAGDDDVQVGQRGVAAEGLEERHHARGRVVPVEEDRAVVGQVKAAVDDLHPRAVHCAVVVARRHGRLQVVLLGVGVRVRLRLSVRVRLRLRLRVRPPARAAAPVSAPG